MGIWYMETTDHEIELGNQIPGEIETSVQVQTIETKQKAIFLVGHGSRFRCLLNELLDIVQKPQDIHRFKNCAVFTPMKI